LQTSLNNKIGLSAVYAGNPLFNDGIQIPITLDDIINTINPGSSIDFSEGLFYILQSEYSNLDFNTYWSLNEEQLGKKLETIFDEYKKMFSIGTLGPSYYTKTFRLNFFSDRGKGPSQNPITNRYSELKTFSLEFKPSDQTELNSAIATMLAYMIALPDTLVDITVADGFIRTGSTTLHFLFADLFSMLTQEYIQTNLYTSTSQIKNNLIKGTFLWDGTHHSGMTEAAYETFLGKISGIFSHEDLRHLLGFNTPFDDVLNTLQRFFRLKLRDRNIVITDFRVK